MYSLVPDSVMRLLSQYNFAVHPDSIEEDLLCIVCRRLVVDAYQSFCGCIYCRECITNHLSGAVKWCCGAKEECREEHLILDMNVIRSAVLNKRVLKIRVCCPNKTCDFISGLAQMEEHMRVCPQQPFECPYVKIGCANEGASRDKVEAHLLRDLFSHSEMLMEVINNLRNELGSMKEDLQMSKSEVAHLKNEGINNEIKMGEIMTILDEERRRSKEILDKVEDQSKLSKDNSNKIANITETQDHMSKEQLRNERMQTESAECLKKSLQETITKVDTRTNTALFTVERFSVKKNKREVVLSPYFYSHSNGYKLRLEVHAGGCDDGRGTHLSAYFIIYKGEYDDLLPWPCRSTVIISVVNQLTGENHNAYSLNYDSVPPACRISFDKPASTANIGLGETTVISHDDLMHTAGLTVGDSVLLRYTVTTPR